MKPMAIAIPQPSALRGTPSPHGTRPRRIVAAPARPGPGYTRGREEDPAMIKAVSHVAVGVRDMERALRFYRDVLGLRVRADLMEEIPPMNGKPATKRRGVYMAWGEGPQESFLVLDQQDQQFGDPAQVFQVGIHHFGF